MVGVCRLLRRRVWGCLQVGEDNLDNANLNVLEDEPDVTDDVLIDVALDAMVPAFLFICIITFPLETILSIYVYIFYHSHINKKVKN